MKPNILPSKAACQHCGKQTEGSRFCCVGCVTAFELRSLLPTSSNKPSDPQIDHDLSRFIVSAGAENHSLNLMVEGMHCASCAFLIEDVLAHEQEVTARVNMTTRRLSLRWHGDATRSRDLLRKIAQLGYKLMPFDPTKLETRQKVELSFLLKCLAVAGFASGNIMMFSVGLWSSSQTTMGFATRDLLHWLSALIALPTLVYAGRPFFCSAWDALRHRRTNMDVPISVALLLTTAMSLLETFHHGPNAYFDSSVMLLFLLLVGRYLDRRTRGHARSAAEDLIMMMAGTATVVDGHQMKLLPIGELRAGMLLHVSAGEKIASDGVVETGASEIDPSFITGETQTQDVGTGTKVLGGMINLTAPLFIRLTASMGESLVGEVIRLMEKAEQGHAHFVRLADRAARLYTPVVHLLAVATFGIWFFLLDRAWQPSLLAATTVLIITCPCALGLAVPAVQVLTSGRLFKRGILVKSADALERLAQVDTIVFDKTGTLTHGTPELGNIAEIHPRDLRLAASLAAHSHHPQAKAICAAFAGELLPIEAFEFPGLGLEGKVADQTVRLGRRDWCGEVHSPRDQHLETWLQVPGQRPIRIVFVDHLREDAPATVSALRREGYDVRLVSGGLAPAVTSAAGRLGIETFGFGVSPTDKADMVCKLRAQGRHVLMVGDGLNDAAALSVADVSMSPASALDIAQNAADIVFHGEQLGPVLEVLQTSKKATRLVKQNFALSFSYNIVAVPVAMLGLVTPLIAAVAMAGSSLLVILNAQRMSR